MLKIDREVSIEGSDQNTLFEWVNDLRNWESLMPSDRIEDWQADADSCSLNLKGLAKLELVKAESASNSVKVINPNGKPFGIVIMISVDGNSGEQNRVELTFEGQMNPFIKAMAEKPLSNFIEGLGQNFKEAIEGK